MQLCVDIAGWFSVDEQPLLDQVFSLGRGNLPPDDLTVRLTVPLYDAIRRTIEAGVPRQPLELAATQQQELESAAHRLADLQAAAAHFLRESMRYAGGRAAVTGVAQLLRYGSGLILARLATYQIDDSSVPPEQKPDWYDIRNRNLSVCREMYRGERVARVRIDHAIDRRSWFVWIPIRRLPSFLSFECIDFDADTWMTHVLPQCVVARTLGVGDEVEWLPSEDLTYVVDSERSTVDPRSPLADAGEGNIRTARLCVNAVTDPPTLRFGPLGMFPPGSSLAFLLDRIQECHAEVVQTGPQEWRAPSAWHAVLFLRDLGSWNKVDRPAHPRFTKAFSDAPGGAFLFRGQRNADWSLTPAIARVESESEQDECGAALARFMLAVTQLSTNAEMPMVDAAGLIGAAQHYGLPTWFLDFTVDPLVAAFFASDGARAGERAAIYWLPIEGALSHGGRLVLAPYWVERLYAQLGCFIGVLDERAVEQLVSVRFRVPEAAAQLAAACYRIVFPASSDLAQSEYGNINGRIYPESVWMTKAIAWARESRMPPLEPAALASELVATAGPAPFVGGSIFPRNHLKMLDFIGRIAEWIALTIREDGSPRSFTIDDGAMRTLFAQNPLVYRQLRFVAELIRKHLGHGPEKRVSVTADVGTKAMLIWMDQHIDAK